MAAAVAAPVPVAVVVAAAAGNNQRERNRSNENPAERKPRGVFFCQQQMLPAGKGETLPVRHV